MKHNAVLVFLHEANDPDDVGFFNDIPVYLAGNPRQEEAEQAIRDVVEEQAKKSGSWFRDFLKVLVIKGTDTCPYKHEDIYG